MTKKDFTVSMATAEYATECDYLGIVSANDVPDKLKKCGLHTVKAENVDAPLIEELPMAVECRLVSYDESTGLMRRESFRWKIFFPKSPISSFLFNILCSMSICRKPLAILSRMFILFFSADIMRLTSM